MSNLPESPHISVLLSEVIDNLTPESGDLIIDGTFGAGGYSRAILAACPDCKVIGIDRDPNAVKTGEELQNRVGIQRFEMRAGRFGQLAALMETFPQKPNGIVLDIGVSSMQLDQAERGFSFMHDGPLDMRMAGPNSTEPSAADLVNELPEEKLAKILWEWGEEKFSRRIAKAIVQRRATKAFTRTLDLAQLISDAAPKFGKPQKIHPATRSFQALRIAVNDELGELQAALSAAMAGLAPGGRLVIVTFHSLEDRLVKRFLRDHSDQAPKASRFSPDHLLNDQDAQHAPFLLLTRQGIKPSKTEIEQNPRSRSAKLRAAKMNPAYQTETTERTIS